MSLLSKSPLANKTPKNNKFFTVSRAHAVKISLLKRRLPRYGINFISFDFKLISLCRILIYL